MDEKEKELILRALHQSLFNVGLGDPEDVTEDDILTAKFYERLRGIGPGSLDAGGGPNHNFVALFEEKRAEVRA